jgi:hypothetical protein
MLIHTFIYTAFLADALLSLKQNVHEKNYGNALINTLTVCVAGYLITINLL